MNKVILFLTFILINSCLFSQKINALIGFSKFYSPENGPYVEVYLSVNSNSINYLKNSKGGFQGNIEITQLFKKENKIVNFKKYKLNTPEVADTSKYLYDIIDIKRFSLANGIYDFEMFLSDINGDTTKSKITNNININFSESTINISDIQFIESIEQTQENNEFVKSGYKIIPFVSSFYPKKLNELKFYFEIYNSLKFFENNENFLLTYYIEKYESNSVVESFYKNTRLTPNAVIPISGAFDLTNLYTGNYNFVVEIKDKMNTVLSTKKLFFQRENNINIDSLADEDVLLKDFTKNLNTDSLRFFVKSLRPITNNDEQYFIDKLSDTCSINNLRMYFLRFWLKRNSNEPQKAWNSYYNKIKYVNKKYFCVGKFGFETDQGRVYLQYGTPTEIIESPFEPNSYPYEIWQYNFIEKGNQSNKRFVFVDNNMGSKEYVLINSDAKGEISDLQWRQRLIPGYSPGDIDQVNTPDHFGKKIDENYKTP